MCNFIQKIIDKIKSGAFIKEIEGKNFVECDECEKNDDCDRDVWMHKFDKDCNYNKKHNLH